MGERGPGRIIFVAAGVIYGIDPIDLICILMKSIKTKFILDPEQDQDTAGHADRQSGNIDERVYFVAEEVSDSDFEIVENHVQSPRL
jgi:hypothetical protein|tara:strand:+ start:169 stop:429 length:261 start_codon:yes stop_codon:yes gene_type:complete